jgi:hypothetical protein
MEIGRLTSQQALRALADGKVLENNDGFEILLQGDNIIMRYTMGKHNIPVEDSYAGTFAGLFIVQEDYCVTG